MRVIFLAVSMFTVVPCNKSKLNCVRRCCFNSIMIGKTNLMRPGSWECDETTISKVDWLETHHFPTPIWVTLVDSAQVKGMFIMFKDHMT